MFGASETANIEFLVFQGQKILIFGAPVTENIDFRCSRDKKYCFLVFRKRELRGGTLLLAKTLPNLRKKPWFWGGEATGA